MITLQMWYHTTWLGEELCSIPNERLGVDFRPTDTFDEIFPRSTVTIKHIDEAKPLNEMTGTMETIAHEHKGCNESPALKLRYWVGSSL